MTHTAGSPEPSSSSGHSDGLAPESMAELTVRVTGALSHTPRTLRVWMTGTETCVRDESGSLLWLENADQTAWVDDGELVVVATRDDEAQDAHLKQPAPEVAALRSLQTVGRWLGVDSASLSPTAGRSQLFGREVEWIDVDHQQLRNLRIARDVRTGIVVHLSGNDPRYGDLLVEVTSIATLPRDPARFEPRVQP